MIRHKRPFPYAKFPREDQLDISYKKFKNAMEHPGHIIEEVWFKGIIGELIDELQKDIGWSQLMAKDETINGLYSQLTAAAERERELNHVVDHMIRESGKQIERERVLVEAVKKAYRKHWLDDPDIGYSELGSILMDALCNTLGDDGFNKWIGEYHAALAQVKGG